MALCFCLTKCAGLCMVGPMAQLTPGQRAAVRKAKARRGELGLTQRQLATKAGVHYRTVQDFERERIWPRSVTLAQIERLGLHWYAGKLSEMAARIDDGDTGDDDLEIAELQRVIADAQARLRVLQDRRALRGMAADMGDVDAPLDRPPSGEDEPPGERPAAG